MLQGGWRLRAPETGNRGRRTVAGLSALALVAGLSGLTATPAAAVEDIDHVALPTTGYAPVVVAASGAGIILAPATDGDPFTVSADGGHTFGDLTAPFFSGQVGYVGAGTVMYTDTTGDSDDSGTFFNLYTYDLSAGTTGAPVKVYTNDPPLAVNANDAVVTDVAAPSGFAAVHLANGQRTTLDVPDRGSAPVFSVDGTTALAASPGYLDSVPMNSASSTPLAVPGLKAAQLSASHAYWVRADATSAALCSAVAATLASPSCRTLDTGDYSSASAVLEAGNGWVVARLVTGGTAREYVYLPGSGTLTKVAPSAGMQSIEVYGRGDTDTPLATVLTASGGYVGTYAAGTVTRLFALPEATAITSALSVTPQSVSGLDNRPAEGVSGAQAWTRGLAGVTPQPEQLLSPRATGLSASGDRTLITATDGAHLLDAGQAPRTIPAATNARALSGPYFLAGSSDNADVMRVDGTTVLASAGHVVALFGSLALRKAGSAYEVVDTTHPSSPLPVSFAACPSGTFEAVGLWGDWVLAMDSGSGDTVVVRYRNGTTCKHHVGAPEAIGDGFALVTPENQGTGNLDLLAWNFLTLGEDLLVSNPTMAATDGSHTVAWTTGSELVVASISDTVTPSAPRVLGVLAAPSVAMGSPWTLDLDASKGLKEAGLGLTITGPGGSAQLDVPEAPNGSVRLTWDGTIDGAPAPAGDYTWTLQLKGADTLQDLVNADGRSGVTGTVTVTGTLPPVTGTTPTVSPASPVVGESVTASPGAWGPNPGVVLSYQWFRGSTPLYLATSADYTPVVDDLDATLTVAVTGKAPGHTPVTRTSAPSAGVAWIAGPIPTLSRAVQVVGKQVTALVGTWSPAGVNSSLLYQWYRDTTPIGGATAASYLPSNTDLGHTLQVRVTGSVAGHPSLTRSSSPSATVISPSFTPIAPVLSNPRPAVDQKVTANPGVWGTDVTFAYQWYRVSGKARAISGATHADYVASAKDVGYKLKVRVTGTGMGKASLYSKLSAKVKKATFATIPLPAITGTARVGMVLTAVPGTYLPVATVKYQWYRGSKAIKKATAATYVLKAADLHKVLKVRITATRPGYVTVVRTVKTAAAITA
jgi:hypothetical protein